MSYIDTPGARLLVRDCGPAHAPPIVLSNSLGTTHHMWDEVSSILSEHFRVIRYDTRGHGGSVWDGSPFEIADLAADVIAILDELRITKAHFAGLSLGGMTGQVLGADHPARIATLSLLATSAYMPPPSGWTDRAVLVRREGTKAILPATLERWFTQGCLKRQTPQVRLIGEEFIDIDREGYGACCEAISRMDLRELGAKISVPTLIIAGANDVATPIEMARDLHQGIADSRLVVLEPAAHLLAVEQPLMVAEHLSRHVLGLSAVGATRQ